MIPESFVTAVALLRGSKRVKGPAAVVIRDALRLLEEAEQELLTTGLPVRRESKRSGAAVEYLVEKTGQGEVLTERRISGKGQQFRCPQRVYDALVAALAELDRPSSLDAVIEMTTRHLGEVPPEFQVRVAIRMWTHLDPPLLLRSRARYRARDRANLMREAGDLWSRLRGS